MNHEGVYSRHEFSLSNFIEAIRGDVPVDLAGPTTIRVGEIGDLFSLDDEVTSFHNSVAIIGRLKSKFKRPTSA